MKKHQLGFVGYGLRAEAMVQAMQRCNTPFEVAAIADPRAEELQAAQANDNQFAQTRYYADDLGMYAKEQLDGVFLGTRCHLHPMLAVHALERNLPLFLEKPVCIDQQGYQQLLPYATERKARVLVSFPLRLTPIVQQMRALVQSGVLGRITQVQATNHVPYGSVYYHSWYRDASLTGGLFLQKMTHDIDYISHILDSRPQRVAAMADSLYYTGDKPFDLVCAQCDAYHTCIESSHVVREVLHEEPTGEHCCFAQGIDNEDSAAVLFQMADGALVSYSQSFVVKRSAGRRGARVIGTRGTAEFDFYTNIITHYPYDAKEPHIKVLPGPLTPHFGGDDALALAFDALLRGQPSIASLQDGLASAAACLAAKQSAGEGRFLPVFYSLEGED